MHVIGSNFPIYEDDLSLVIGRIFATNKLIVTLFGLFIEAHEGRFGSHGFLTRFHGTTTNLNSPNDHI